MVVYASMVIISHQTTKSPYADIKYFIFGLHFFSLFDFTTETYREANCHCIIFQRDDNIDNIPKPKKEY